MTTAVVPESGRKTWPALSTWPREAFAPALLIAVTAVLLYARPATSLAMQWWSDDDAGHGLLLFPLSLWLAWRSGLSGAAEPSRRWGILALSMAIVSRALGGLAAELYTQRIAIWLSAVGIILFFRGWKQLRHWWLPATLTFLSVPLPDLVMNSLSLPLQRVASEWGTALIRWRHVPVDTQGNVMSLVSPETGNTFRLFVAEACSGLRSLTALLALGIAVGGMYLRTVTSRVLLLTLAVPVAIALNTVRVFLTAYLMYYISPEFGTGFMHKSEGWGLFAIAFLILGGFATLFSTVESIIQRRRSVGHG